MHYSPSVAVRIGWPYDVTRGVSLTDPSDDHGCGRDHDRGTKT